MVIFRVSFMKPTGNLAIEEELSMFDVRRCSIPDCDRNALEGSDFCAAHVPKLEFFTSSMLESLKAMDSIKNMNMAGLRFEGADLSAKKFYACSFSRSALKNMIFANCVFRMCFFDFASADSCDFSGIDAQFCSFAGTYFLNSSFEQSELVHNNFDGANMTDCTFNYSNLYNSRFIMSEFERTDFIDCNLKRSYIIPSKEIDVSWRLSNTEEAIRELDRIEQ